MLRVAVDAMGGDHAPAEIVKGVVSAVNKMENLEVLLVGSRDSIKKSVGNKINDPRIRIINTQEVIAGDEDPGLAIRSKRNSSMMTAMHLVCHGKADAVISAGNTGALMGGGLLFLKRIKGIKRPALLTIIPALQGGGTVLLDIGANMDAKPEHLLQYALMGRVYAREMLGKENPSVALLNVGSEGNKGNTQIKNAYQLFAGQDINFVGNVEATELFRNPANVLVCDGFVGNVLLKAIEGFSRDIFDYIRQEIAKDFKAWLASPMVLPVFQRARAVLDESEYGGSLLIGVRGVCFKCHGSSRERAIMQAILKQVYPFVHKNINQKIEKALKQDSYSKG
ncbi:MAG: phosphate acyltransferase PlsX [Firmicutes bacterium]|nr:phosphate acyltransferase PlsX [Bacillota bacterium]